jgi:hypothetical protein
MRSPPPAKAPRLRLQSTVFTLLFLLGLGPLPSLLASESGSEKPRHHLLTSGAPLLDAPEEGAPSKIRLPLATPVEILGKTGAFTRVRTLYGEGYLKRPSLSPKAPSAKNQWALAQKTPAHQSKIRLKRVRMTVALDPSHEAAIAELEKLLDAQGSAKLALMAKRGLVAAKKRNASWDGPLYLVQNGLALLPMTCFSEVQRGQKPRRQALTVPQLRGRAWSLVNSGKAVALTENTAKWQLLHTRACLDHTRCEKGQAAYLVDDKGGDGVMVPSWLVAGHQKALMKKADSPPPKISVPPCTEKCEAFVDAHWTRVVQIDSTGATRRWRVWERTLDGWGTSPWHALPDTEARFFPHTMVTEKVTEARFVFVAPPHFKQEGPKYPGQAFVGRVARDAQGALHLENGQLFTAALPSACPAPPPDQDGPPY